MMLIGAGDSLKVKTDGSHDKLVGRQATINEICVVNDVSTEDKSSADGVDKIHCLAKGDEDAN